MCVDKAVGNGNSYFDLISFSALLQPCPFVRLIFSLLSSLKIYIYIFKLYAFIYTSISTGGSDGEGYDLPQISHLQEHTFLQYTRRDTAIQTSVECH